jgi:hypothetical protein
MFWRLLQPSGAGAVCQVKLFTTQASLGGFVYNVKSSHLYARMGSMGYQGQQGGTLGSTAQWAVQADPAAAAVLSGATPQTTGLGGQARFTAPATGVTEGAIFSYLNPAGTASIQGKTLLVNGVSISAVNIGASVATTATVLSWSLAFGSTASPITTAEAATTKAPRRIGLGIMTWPIGALIGAMPDRGDISRSFDTPIAVNPGEFFQIVTKCITGTATASQVIWVNATVDGYFM